MYITNCNAFFGIRSENTRYLLESIFAMSSPGLLAADTSKLQLPSTTSAIGTWTFSMIRKTLGSSESVLKQGGSQQSVDSLDIDNDEEGHEAGLETDWYVEWFQLNCLIDLIDYVIES